MKLTDLVNVVSEVTGEDHGVVRVKARALREAGLIVSGGRGRGGAEMGERDVARLILSLLSSQSTTADRQVSTMEAAVPTIVKWSWHTGNSRSGAYFNGPPPPLCSLPIEHSVTDAMDALFRQGVDVLDLSNERTVDGEVIALGFRGVADDPDEGGQGGVDWWVDYAVPNVSPSHIRSVRSLDGYLIDKIVDQAMGRAR